MLPASPSPAGGYTAAASAPAPGPSPKAARTLADAHLRCCLYAGVKLSGADVAGEGVHSYRVGPSPGVDLGDDLWTSRWVGTVGPVGIREIGVFPVLCCCFLSLVDSLS